MKKFFKISVIAVLVLAVAITAFAFTSTSSQLAFGNVCPNVGWNTRAPSCTFGAFALPNVQELAYSISGPIFTPYVGWNT
jgi:hypothetical protein